MKTPYYAVIFTSKRTAIENEAYEAMAQKMVHFAQEQPGFLGVESAREGIGITVSYWETLEAIKNWKDHWEHLEAQDRGKTDWYQWYNVRICKVERDYSFEK